MRRTALALGTAIAVFSCGAAARAEGAAAGLAPYQLVRSLQLVQDRVASGDHAALPIQRKLLEMIDLRLREASAAEMMQPINFRSMMVYAMSGGNPATLTSVLFRLHLDDRQSRIAGAVMAYLKGSPQFTAVALKGVEPMQEPADIGASLALVKGSVISLEDPRGALKLLDQARLLAPGTLVEEAALRRSVGLAAAIGDAARFTLATDQYVRSFIRSPYASQFADSFVAGVVTLRDSLDLEQIAATVSMMKPDQRKVLYLRIARRAAIEGLVALSQFASERAEGVAVGDEDLDPRILLYTSLTSVTTEPSETLKQTIAKIDRSRLSSGDRELLDAVSAVSSEIVGAPTPASRDRASAPGPAVVSANAPPEIMAASPATKADTPDLARKSDSAVAPTREQPPTAQMAADVAASHEATSEADGIVADGRRKLAEIDELLAGATQ